MRSGVFSIAIGNLASKSVGLLREIAFAAWFGTGATAAAFRVAQTAYLLPTQALIGDSLSAGLLPLYRDLKFRDKDAARVLVVLASFYALLFSAVVTAGLYFYAREIAMFIAPGASQNAQELAGRLLAVLALSTPFYILSGMLSYVEAGYGHYGAIAWRPMLLNIGSIAGAGLAVFTKQDLWLATGILISHIGFFAWTAVEFCRLDRLLPERRQAWALARDISGRFLRNMSLLIGLPMMAQATVLVERIVSSRLGTEIIPSADYARFIADTTVQLIAVPLGILTMSQHGGASSDTASNHIRRAAATILAVSVPIALVIGLNTEAIVRLLFARGAFNARSVVTTTAILRSMGGCLGLTVTAYYLIKALNAQMRNVEAVIATLAGALMSCSVNLLLWRTLGVQTIGFAAVAYNATIFLFATTRLHLWRSLAPTMIALVIGCLIYAVPAIFFNLHLRYPFNLAINMVIAGAFWTLYFLVNPSLRASVAKPLLRRFPITRWFGRLVKAFSR